MMRQIADYGDENINDLQPAPSGKTAMWEELLSYRKCVFSLCLGFSRNPADAQDLCQETYVKALANPPNEDNDHRKLWLLCIAKHICLDQERKKKVRRLRSLETELEAVEWRTPEIQIGQVEQIALVKRAIGCLSKKLREVLVLREYGDLSYEDIGKVLKIGEGTVMSRLNRARKAVIRFYQEGQDGKTK